MKIAIPLFLFAVIGLCVAAVSSVRIGDYPGCPYFTTNVLASELTDSVTFVISNGQPYVIKQ